MNQDAKAFKAKLTAALSIEAAGADTLQKVVTAMQRAFSHLDPSETLQGKFKLSFMVGGFSKAKDARRINASIRYVLVNEGVSGKPAIVITDTVIKQEGETTFEGVTVKVSCGGA
jgi:hypothetical protein